MSDQPPPPPPPLPSSGSSGPNPPLNRTKSYLQFQPRRAIASFENLVVLANYEERLERLKEARKMVWRDRGEPAVEVRDLWECGEHGVRGGLSAFLSFVLSFHLRWGCGVFGCGYGTNGVVWWVQERRRWRSRSVRGSAFSSLWLGSRSFRGMYFGSSP